MKRFIHFLTVVAVLGVISSSAQRKTAQRVSAPAPMKIKTNEPSVYISFVRFGKRQPLRDGESGDGIWLSLNNNLRHKIRFCAFGISPEGEQMILHNEQNRIGVYYDIVANPRPLTDNSPEVDVPVGYPIGGICHETSVAPGTSQLFAVPKEHLPFGVSLRISINYDWEDTSEPVHLVYFNSLDVPGIKRPR